jgi:hypothetical protein
MPFVLDIYLQMDNCSGTNKSQYVFGGLALLLSVGLLDVMRPRFMIAGHTKFGPMSSRRRSPAGLTRPTSSTTRCSTSADRRSPR